MTSMVPVDVLCCYDVQIIVDYVPHSQRPDKDDPEYRIYTIVSCMEVGRWCNLA